MRIRWRDFEIPNSVVCEAESRTQEYGKFFVEPFERGFGTTVGNSIRRILLSSLEGAALVYAKIEGVQHEFSTLSGVYEDVTDIVLNLKGVLFMLFDGNVTELRIRAKKKGEVRAADIEHGPEVKIVNPDALIATLTEDVPFNVDLRVQKGRGYSTADENAQGDNEIGVIWTDSAFSPVSRVRYKTEDTRVGQVTNYDRLILEIWRMGRSARTWRWSKHRKFFASTLTRSFSTTTWATLFSETKVSSKRKPSPTTRRNSSVSLPCPSPISTFLRGLSIAWSRPRSSRSVSSSAAARWNS